MAKKYYYSNKLNLIIILIKFILITLIVKVKIFYKAQTPNFFFFSPTKNNNFNQDLYEKANKSGKGSKGNKVHPIFLSPEIKRQSAFTGIPRIQRKVLDDKYAFVHFFMNPTNPISSANLHNIEKSVNFVMHHNIMRINKENKDNNFNDYNSNSTNNIGYDNNSDEFKIKILSNKDLNNKSNNYDHRNNNFSRTKEKDKENYKVVSPHRNFSAGSRSASNEKYRLAGCKNSFDRRIYNLIEWLKGLNLNLIVNKITLLDNDDFLNACANGTLFPKVIGRLEGV